MIVLLFVPCHKTLGWYRRRVLLNLDELLDILLEAAANALDWSVFSTVQLTQNCLRVLTRIAPAEALWLLMPALPWPSREFVLSLSQWLHNAAWRKARKIMILGSFACSYTEMLDLISLDGDQGLMSVMHLLLAFYASSYICWRGRSLTG